jgi:hypothetical protein
MDQLSQSVFIIAAYQAGVPVFRSHGTGFFIDNVGTFISAGHNFKNPFRTCKAVIDGRHYDISALYEEYNDYQDQEPPIYRDLFIGKIEGVASANFYPLVSAKQLKSDSPLIAAGYTSKNEAEPVSMDSLFEDVLATDYEAPDLSEDANKLRVQRYGTMSVKFGGDQFLHIDRHADHRPVFENGFTIDVPMEDPHGYSGGPILDNNNSVGMLIGENGAISSDYIISKLSRIAKSKTLASPVWSQMAVQTTPQNKWLEDAVSKLHEKFNISGADYAAHWEDILYVSSLDVPQLPIKVQDMLLRDVAGTQGNNYWGPLHKSIHLVIVNPVACEQAKFSKPELEAVIAHELGHIFNMNTPITVPNPLKLVNGETTYDDTETKQVQYQNRLNSELYADDFVKRKGLSNALIRGLEKSNGLPGVLNGEMTEARLRRLREEQPALAGVYRPLTPIPPR